jgi:hypothetical protein
MESFKYLTNYGFTIDNNPFAVATLRAPNYFKMLSDNELALCGLVGCLDPTFHEYNGFNFYESFRNESKMQYKLTKL